MTDSTTRIPTDADIIALADKTRTGEPGRDGYILPISFARAVLARWGAPQAAALPPHVPLTDDQMREVLTDEAFAGETKSEKSKWAVHEKSMLIMIDFCRAVERAHGIAAA